MTTLTDRLAEWEALAGKATPGPWTWGAIGYQEPDAYVVRDADNECLATLDYDGVSYHAAEFMAESRTAVPALVEALRAVLFEHHAVPIYLLDDECGHVPDDHEVMESDTGDTLCLDSPTGEFECETCRDDEGHHAAWPCSTVRVIADALGVDL